jgi:DNA-binding HxlR family transcriptional regulator
MSEPTKKKIVYSDTQCTKHLSAMDDALFVIGGKWKLRVMIAILGGHVRFNEMQRTLTGISARVLSSELKDLEENGLVTRVVHANQKPVVVEYLPTEYSKTLTEVIGLLAQWGAKHRQRIMKNG